MEAKGVDELWVGEKVDKQIFWDEFSIYFSASLIIDSDHKFACF